MGFSGGASGEESTCHAGDVGSIPALGRSGGVGNGSPLQYSCLGKFHGQRSLAGCNPWGRKESDMTGHTHIQHIICILEYVFQKSWVHMSTFNSDLPPQGSFYFSSFRNPFFLTENSDPWKPQRIYSFAQFCISSKMVSELLCPHCYQKDQYGICLRFPLSSYSARGWGYIIKYCIRFTFFFICLQCIYLYSLEIQLNSFVLLCFQL